MRSLPNSLRPGNVNLRGKRTKPMGCGCCVAENFRYRIRDIEHRKEMLNWRDDVLQETDWDDEYPKFDKHQDYGRWEMFERDGKVGICSSDFSHDVEMYITGDFASIVDRMKYAAMIAARLNRTNPRYYD